MLNNMKIKTKMILLSVIILTVFSIVNTLFSIYLQMSNAEHELKEFSEKSMEDAQFKLKMVSDTLITSFEGKTTEEIIEIVKKTRYDNGSGYFWINDLTQPYPVMIYHPISTSLNGNELNDVKYNVAGIDKKNFFAVLAEKCKNEGEGYVEYLWPKPNESEPQPKLSYGKKIGDNMLIGTGFYIDDINKRVMEKRAEQQKLIMRNILINSVLTLLMLIIGVVMMVRLANMISRNLQKVSDVSFKISEGDLTVRIDNQNKDEIGEMARNLNVFLDKLMDIISEIKNASTNLASSATEMSSQMKSIADGTIEQIEKKSELETNFRAMTEKMNKIMDTVKMQAAAVEEVASSISEIAQTSVEVAKNSDVTMKMSEKSVSEAAEGGESVKKTLEGIVKIETQVKNTEEKILKLNTSSEEIGDIVRTIGDIAEQTNLLALNAAIEAAHAGDAGKGFAVVADEIKELAEKSKDATRQIEKLIHGIQNEVSMVIMAAKNSFEEVVKSSKLSKEAENKLKSIIENIEKTNVEVGNISKAMEEQAGATQEISNAIQHMAEGSAEIEGKSIEQLDELKKANISLSKMSEIVENTTASTQETAAASHELSNLAENLDMLTSKFKVQDNKELKEK